MEKVSERVLVFAAHPDDETLGCGATLVRHARRGDQISIVAFADGVGSRAGAGIAGVLQSVAERHGMMRRACKILGTEDVWLHQFPDNRMDRVDMLQIVQQAEEHLKRFKPTLVYTHHGSDVNIDHRITHDAVVVATRPQPGSSVRLLLFFEVPSSTEWQVQGRQAFQPNHFEDVRDTLQVKLDAMNCYTTELHPFPHPRSLEGIKTLAAQRGVTVGLPAAEAFMVGRSIS